MVPLNAALEAGLRGTFRPNRIALVILDLELPWDLELVILNLEPFHPLILLEVV